MKFQINIDTGERRSGRTSRAVRAAVEWLLEETRGPDERLCFYAATKESAQDIRSRIEDSIPGDRRYLTNCLRREVSVGHRSVQVIVGGPVRGTDPAIEIADHHYAELSLERIVGVVKELERLMAPGTRK